MGITFCLFAMPMLSNRVVLDSDDANEEIDGVITGDVVDSDNAGSSLKMTPSFTMQLATDALLDYVTENY